MDLSTLASVYDQFRQDRIFLDTILTNPSVRAQFLSAVDAAGIHADEGDILRAMVDLRKRGELGPRPRG